MIAKSTNFLHPAQGEFFAAVEIRLATTGALCLVGVGLGGFDVPASEAKALRVVDQVHNLGGGRFVVCVAIFAAILGSLRNWRLGRRMHILECPPLDDGPVVRSQCDVLVVVAHDVDPLCRRGIAETGFGFELAFKPQAIGLKLDAAVAAGRLQVPEGVFFPAEGLGCGLELFLVHGGFLLTARNCA